MYLSGLSQNLHSEGFDPDYIAVIKNCSFILEIKLRIENYAMNITWDSYDHAFYFSADWGRHYYVAVCCFVVFNLADYAGKQLAVWIQSPGPSKIGQISLLTATILRCALIPLFMFSNVSVGNRKTEIAFNSDAFYISFMVLLGFTNGYIGNIAMMFGPKCVKNNDHQVILYNLYFKPRTSSFFQWYAYD